MDLEEFNRKAKEIFENEVVPQIEKAKMKQTAVEFLVGKMITNGALDFSDITKAKEMEKEQIMNAHRHGFTEGTCFGATTIYKFMSAEQYYNETFKSK